MGEVAKRFGGTVVKSTGDGHLTTFDGPTQAIRCAEALSTDAETLGIEIRIGIHTGECELLDADIGGLAVHIAARTSAMPKPATSSSQAPSATWWSARARVSRTAAASSCAACQAPGTPGGRPPRRSGGIGRGATGVNTHPRPSDRDAPVGPRCRTDGQAHAVAPPRDGSPRAGHWSQMTNPSRRSHPNSPASLIGRRARLRRYGPWVDGEDLYGA